MAGAAGFTREHHAVPSAYSNSVVLCCLILCVLHVSVSRDVQQQEPGCSEVELCYNSRCTTSKVPASAERLHARTVANSFCCGLPYCMQEELMDKAKLKLSQARRRLNVVFKQSRSNLMLYVVLFIIGLCLFVFILAKLRRLGRWIY